jgi:hypothetical protein
MDLGLLFLKADWSGLGGAAQPTRNTNPSHTAVFEIRESESRLMVFSLC